MPRQMSIVRTSAGPTAARTEQRRVEGRDEERCPQVHLCHRAGLADRSRVATRYRISSAQLTADRAASAVRAHRALENSLYWTLDMSLADDKARLRKGHGAKSRGRWPVAARRRDR
jgi:hypothetical protein